MSNSNDWVYHGRYNKDIKYFAKNMIVQNTSVKLGDNPYIDPSQTCMLDLNLRKNNAKNTSLKYENAPLFMIGKEHVFKRYSLFDYRKKSTTMTAYDTESLEIYNTGSNGVGRISTNGNEFKKTFSELIGANEGVYKVVERDSFGNILTYYLQYDLTPPTLKVQYSEVGSEQMIDRIITSKDILSLYLDTFKIEGITDLEGIPIGNYYVKIDGYSSPEINGMGQDRRLSATLANGESYNAILAIDILRNGISLGDSYEGGQMAQS